MCSRKDRTGKRIGIKTVACDVLLSNYGSFFQHYALRCVVRGMGFSPYRLERASLRDELLKWMLPIRLLRTRVLSWFGCKEFMGWRAIKCLGLRAKFIRDYRCLIGALFEDQGDSTAFIAGGDSVWYDCDTDAFLMGYSGKKIAYAASSIWDLRATDIAWCDLAKTALESYVALGVREVAGADLLMRLNADLCPQVVVDPVMLLSSSAWMRLAGSRKVFVRPTVLYYAVNTKSVCEINAVAVKECAERMKCDLVCVGIQGAEDVMPRNHRETPSPTRFIAMMRDARYVITNSFHGIVFSLMMGRPFAFVEQQIGGRGDVNLRQRELLKKFDIIDRELGAAPTAEKLYEVLQRPLDMVSLSKKLSFERTLCLNWLKEALDDAT